MSDQMQILQQIFEAATGGHWWIVAALVVGLLVRILKSPNVLGDKIPPRVRAPLAVGLGIVAGVLADIVGGVPFWPAITGGVLAGLTAILGHVFVIEGIAGGREIGPGMFDSGGGKGKPPTPPPLAIFALGTFLCALVLGVGRPGPVTLEAIQPASVVVGCASWTRQDTKTVVDGALTATDLACINGSPLTEADAVAAACGILKTPALRELLRALIGQREAARRAGYVWPALDAGAPPAAGDQ